MLGIYVLAGAIVLFVVDVVLVVFFGGIKAEFQGFMFRSATIEFPLAGLLISIFGAGVGNLYYLCLVCAIKVLKTQSLSVESAP